MKKLENFYLRLLITIKPKSQTVSQILREEREKNNSYQKVDGLLSLNINQTTQK